MLQLVVLLGLGVMCEEFCDLVERGEADTLYCRITYVCVRCESKGLYTLQLYGDRGVALSPL